MKNRRRRIKWLVVSASIGGLFALACSVGTDGTNTERFQMAYQNSELEGGPADNALATGTHVDLEIHDTWEEAERQSSDGDPHRADDGDHHCGAAAEAGIAVKYQALPVVDAYSEDAETVEVVGQTDDGFRLKANAPTPPEGTMVHAVVEAESSCGSIREYDTQVPVHTSEPDRVDVDPRCEAATYLTDTVIEFDYALSNGTGEALVGNGSPVSVQPEEGGVARNGTRLNTLRVDAGPAGGEYLVAPDLPGDASEFRLVEPHQLTDLSVSTDVDASIQPGSRQAVGTMMLHTDSDFVCPSTGPAVEIGTSTPEVCSATYQTDPAVEDGFALIVEGHAEGDCQIALRVPASDLEEQIEVSVRQ